MPQAKALITHHVLKWARERRNITENAVAKRLGTSVDKVRSWETNAGDDHPTIRQAQNIAGFLNVPLGYLFLSDPPTLSVEIPDLRTIAGGPVQNPSPEFIDHLYDLLRKQSWLREYRQSQNMAPLPFINRFPPGTSVDVIAEDICQVIGIDAEARRATTNWDAFLTALVRKAEAVGILVMRSSIVESNTHRQLSVEEFRGFAITDEIAPVIFINSRDAKVAQIFTLAHEVAHLWIGKSGVSNQNYALRPDQQVNAIDRLCDKVAAEVLVPRADFINRWNAEETAHNIQALAAHYRVSRFVVLRRAYDLQVISEEEFRNYYDEFRGDYHEPSRERGNFYNLFLARNSSTVTYAVLTATYEGRMSRLEAASLLNVRAETVDKARKKLLGLGARSPWSTTGWTAIRS